MSMTASKEREPEEGPDIIIDLPDQNCSHSIPRSVSFFSLKEKHIIATKHHWARWQEIFVFVLPLMFSTIPVIVLMTRASSRREEDVSLRDLVTPVVCFSVIVMYHVYMLFYSRKGAITFFSRMRLAWAKVAFAKGAVDYVNTLRDFMRITTFLASQAMLMASILSSVTYKRFGGCDYQIQHCDTRILWTLSQLLALIMHHFFVFINLVQATRFIMHASFMLNTTYLNGRPIKSDALVSIMSRANMFYSLGLRQFYFDLPLFAWLLGPWALLVVTLLYLAFIRYVETVDGLLQLMHDSPSDARSPSPLLRSRASSEVGSPSALPLPLLLPLPRTTRATSGGGGGGGGGGAASPRDRIAGSPLEVSGGKGYVRVDSLGPHTPDKLTVKLAGGEKQA